MGLMICEFKVLGKPIGKGRPRFSKAGHTYTPPETKAYEKKVQKVAWATMKHNKLEVSNRRINMIINCYFEIPKSYGKKKTQECQVGIIIPPRPDIDNVGKAVCDACNKVVYYDDCQIWCLSMTKRFCDEGQAPHVHVKIQWDDPSKGMTNLDHKVLSI